MAKRGNNSAIKGQMVVHNELTNETIRVPLGAPKARQWNSPESATQYLQSLVGSEQDNKLDNICVNDTPILNCSNLVSLRQQGGIINVTAKVLKPVAETSGSGPGSSSSSISSTPMELETTQIDGVGLKVQNKAQEKSFEDMTPLERMLSVPPEQWLY